MVRREGVVQGVTDGGGHDNEVSAHVRPVAVTVSPTATLREAAETMIRNDIGFVVVLRAKRIMGVVSERDLVRAMSDRADPDDERVADVMSVDLAMAAPCTSVADAVRIMLGGDIRHLPVTDNGRLVGVISIRDLLAAVAPERN